MKVRRATKLQNVRYDIRGPATTLAIRMEQEGIPVINLNTGNPAAFGFKPPNYSAVLEEQMQLAAAYSASKGLTNAREAIAAYESGKGLKNVLTENVYTGNGVSELIVMCMQALLDEGDEVLIPTPDYPLWTAAVRLAGGVAVHYVCNEEDSWYPDMDDIKSKVSPRTKAVVIISPNNPTGAVYPREILEGFCDLAQRNELLIFSDEIYDRMLLDDNKHIAVGSITPDLPVITMNGLSKSHKLCGYRSGWMVLSGNLSGLEEYIEGINVLASMRLCSNVNAQVIIPAALQDAHFANEHLLPGGRLYEQRESAYRGLSGIPGISVVKSKAGLYMFPKMDTEKFGIKDDERLVFDLLKQKHVLLTHGGSYNWPAPDHFRMVYLPEKEVLDDVIERLRDFFANYSQ